MSQVQPPAAPAAQPVAPMEQQNATSDPDGRPPAVARVLEHIPAAYGDSDSQP
jgi:hypothetical protein